MISLTTGKSAYSSMITLIFAPKFCEIHCLYYVKSKIFYPPAVGPGAVGAHRYLTGKKRERGMGGAWGRVVGEASSLESSGFNG